MLVFPRLNAGGYGSQAGFAGHAHFKAPDARRRFHLHRQRSYTLSDEGFDTDHRESSDDGRTTRSVMNVSLEEVKLDPEGFLRRVIDGETLVVTEHDRPVAEIRPIEAVHRSRPFGLAAGSFVVPDDFDDPLPEEVLRDFEQ